MTNKNMLTFRASDRTIEMLNRLMDERGIDRTSALRLALYVLDIYMRRPRVQRMNLHEIVRELERHAIIAFREFSHGKTQKPKL